MSSHVYRHPSFQFYQRRRVLPTGVSIASPVGSSAQISQKHPSRNINLRLRERDEEWKVFYNRIRVAPLVFSVNAPSVTGFRHPVTTRTQFPELYNHQFYIRNRVFPKVVFFTSRFVIPVVSRFHPSINQVIRQRDDFELRYHVRTRVVTYGVAPLVVLPASISLTLKKRLLTLTLKDRK